MAVWPPFFSEKSRRVALTTLIPSFESLAERDRDAILAYALRLSRNRDDAEDLTQEALRRAAVAFGQFDGRNFKAWVRSIVHNEFVNRLKRGRRAKALALDLEPEMAASGPSPYDLAAGDEIPDVIMDAVDRLPATMARVFLLMQIAGFSIPEVAALEGIPTGTVQSRLFRARKELRVLLADYARDQHGVGV